MDYLTPCNGSCATFDPSAAGWTKIAECARLRCVCLLAPDSPHRSGLDVSQTLSPSLRARMLAKPEQYFPTSGPGLWAQAKLLQAGSAWNVSIPRQLAPGQYVLRSELAAVHNPLGPASSSGPQHYIACVQLSVYGVGTQVLPLGTRADALYDPAGAFAGYDVYVDKGRTFKVPGPPVWVPTVALEPPVSPSTAPETVPSTASTTASQSAAASAKAAFTSSATPTSSTTSTATTCSSSTLTPTLVPLHGRRGRWRAFVH